MWRHGKVNSFPVIHCCMVPTPESDCSLWVFWFYRYRQPEFYEDLVGKKKGSLEGVNVVWLRWPKETDEFVRRLGLPVSGEVKELGQPEKEAAISE